MELLWWLITNSYVHNLMFITLIIYLACGIRFIKEYDRLVIFTFGRCKGIRGPGLTLLFPGIQTEKKVDLRVITMAIPMQEVITKDNISAKTAAVCFFQVTDPYKTVTKVEDPFIAINQAAQTALRNVVGQHDLDELLTERDVLNQKLNAMIERQTEGWGIKVQSVEVKDVEIPESMQRAMARQAEAERERRAKIVAADGELQAAEKLAEAARMISASPGAMQLRQLQTMVEVSAENNSTIIFPIPIELFESTRKISPQTVESAIKPVLSHLSQKPASTQSQSSPTESSENTLDIARKDKEPQ